MGKDYRTHYGRANVHIAMRDGSTLTLALPIAPAIGQRIEFQQYGMTCKVVDVVHVGDGLYVAIAEQV